MDDTHYRIIFSGRIRGDAKPEAVRTALAQMFNLRPQNTQHKQKLAKLFSGRRVVIKQGLPLQRAQKYLDALEACGAISRIEAMNPADYVAGSPHGIERRARTRRKMGDRRSVKRASSIQPDRRKNLGRREGEVLAASYAV